MRRSLLNCRHKYTPPVEQTDLIAERPPSSHASHGRWGWMHAANRRRRPATVGPPAACVPHRKRERVRRRRDDQRPPWPSTGSGSGWAGARPKHGTSGWVRPQPNASRSADRDTPSPLADLLPPRTPGLFFSSASAAVVRASVLPGQLPLPYSTEQKGTPETPPRSVHIRPTDRSRAGRSTAFPPFPAPASTVAAACPVCAHPCPRHAARSCLAFPPSVCIPAVIQPSPARLRTSLPAPGRELLSRPRLCAHPRPSHSLTLPACSPPPPGCFPSPPSPHSIPPAFRRPQAAADVPRR